MPLDIGPGDICLFSFTSPADIWSLSGFSTALALTRALLAPLLAQPESVSGTVLRRGSPMGDILFGQVRSSLEAAERLQLIHGPGLAASTAAMIAVCFGPSSDRRHDQGKRLRAASLVAIKRHIEDSLHVVDLGAEHLIDMFGLSRAALYWMFAPLGGVAQFIRNRRLRRAFSELATGETDQDRIDELARRIGFTSASVFSRAFKAAYGLSPSEVRGNKLTLAMVHAAAATDDEAPLAQWLHGLA